MSLCKTLATRIALLVLLALLVASPARAQEDRGGIIVETEAVELTIGGRLQLQANTTTASTEPTTDLFMRRIRVNVEARVTDLVSARVQPEFAGERVRLTDAFVTLEFSPAFHLLVGRTYRPFSRLELTSDNLTPPVERGAAIRGVEALDEYELVSGLGYSDRDMGVQLRGSPQGLPWGLEYAAGVFTGPLYGETGRHDTYQLAARATVRPVRRVELGAGWSRRDFSRAATSPNELELRAGNAFEVDVEYGSFTPGWHLVAELATGDFDPFADVGFRGAQAWLAYRTERLGEQVLGLEPTFRVSRGTLDAGAAPLAVDAGGTLLTPGVNLYFTPISRVLLNYDRWLPGAGGPVAWSFKAQLQMAF